MNKNEWCDCFGIKIDLGDDVEFIQRSKQRNNAEENEKIEK